MASDRLIVAFHAAAVALALTAALFWPRAGQAALLVPLGSGGMRSVLQWADHAHAPLLAIDSTTGRVIARIVDNQSLFSAIGAGILPVATQTAGCVAGDAK